MTQSKRLQAAQESILKKRGLRRYKDKSGKNSKLVPDIESGVSNFPKTYRMQLVELKYHVKLEDLLVSGSLSYMVDVVKGEVDRSTFSRWRDQLKLAYTETNLPSCINCKHRVDYCSAGACYILIALNMTPLLKAKREEIERTNNEILQSRGTNQLQGSNQKADNQQ